VLDAAERLDRLEPMGRHLRQLTANGAADAAAAGIVFVNLHPRDLFDPTLTEPGTGLSAIASRVVLEITERASLDNLGNAKKRAAELREHGYKIAIDDLGAGYAGLTAFAMLEPEIVKLDMTLVRDVDKNPTKRAVVRTMAQLAHELGMQVVAEGVETRAELDAVIEAGCDLLQGFLLAKPGPPFPSFAWPR
jgi:EAL domain-containing protein (putative c-di-GMP-specific phosphodiesterase class I)